MWRSPPNTPERPTCNPEGMPGYTVNGDSHVFYTLLWGLDLFGSALVRLLIGFWLGFNSDSLGSYCQGLDLNQQLSLSKLGVLTNHP